MVSVPNSACLHTTQTDKDQNRGGRVLGKICEATHGHKTTAKQAEFSMSLDNKNVLVQDNSTKQLRVIPEI